MKLYGGVRAHTNAEDSTNSVIIVSTMSVIIVYSLMTVADIFLALLRTTKNTRLQQDQTSRQSSINRIMLGSYLPSFGRDY
jgi:hypothetical protein